jgi:hypothetical protein
MHARIDQLLSLRDGEPVDGAAARHVEACPSCSEALSGLVRRTGALRDLPLLDAPPGAFERIRAEVQKPPVRRDHRRAFAIAASVIAVLAVSVAFIAGREEATLVVEESREIPMVIETATVPQLAQLVEQSRELEQLLQGLPARPRIERVSTAATIDGIEQRIQWLDFQLSNAPEAAMSDAQSQQLWSERVTLMDSLVKVRYAEAQRVSF